MNATLALVADNTASFGNARLEKVLEARSILGSDLVIAEEIMYETDVSYTKGQLAHLVDTLPPLNVLQFIKEKGFGLVPYEPEVLEGRPLAASGWLALRKVAPTKTRGLIWDAQLEFLKKKSYLYVPAAPEVTWFAKTFQLLRSEHLFTNPVRTSTRGASGHICVRSGGSESCTPDEYLDPRLGLAIGLILPAKR